VCRGSEPRKLSQRKLSNGKGRPSVISWCDTSGCPLCGVTRGTKYALAHLDHENNNPTEAEMHYSQGPASDETVKQIRDEIAANNQQDGGNDE
jgi:hypothetical protein